MPTSFPRFAFEISEIEFDPVFDILRPLVTQVVVQICRFWLVAWATSHRMHETSPLPCVFGCVGCADRLSHYLFCFPFWRAIVDASPLPDTFEDDPFSRLGLVSDRCSLLSAAVATHLYHAARHRHDGCRPISQRQLSELALASWSTMPRLRNLTLIDS